MANNTLRKLHRTNALLLLVFIVLHLINHMTIVLGIDNHLAVMEALRIIYRFLPVEILLFALFFAQMIIGLMLIFRRGKPQGGWAWLQVLSGGYIAFFLLQHMTAAVATRMIYALDTNSYWAAGVVSKAPFVWYFVPYYVLGIVAIFAHLACALRFRSWPAPATKVQVLLPWAGLVVGVIVVSGLMGSFSPVNLPVQYQAYLDNYWSSN